MVQFDRLLLAVIFKLRGVFVLIMISIMGNDCMCILEVIGRLSTDTICEMRVGADSSVNRHCCSLCHEF